MLRQIKKQTLIKLALPFSSALLLSLSFSFSSCWFLAWFSFVPLFFALDKKSAFGAFLTAYFTGVLFWAGTIYWLVHVTIFGQALLILYLALYFGIFGLLITRRFARCPLLFIPCLWITLEYLRSRLLTGFPWALLGYSQYANLAVIQIADIAGVELVSFLVMFMNAAIKETLLKRRWKYLFFAVLLMVLSLIYARSKLNNGASGSGLRISVVQGNIPQRLKWNSAAKGFIMERYLDLTAATLKDRPDLVIWPEAALPVIPEEEPEYYARVAGYVKTLERPLLFGAVTKRGELYYNSALLLSKEGELARRYDKLHLVPFGEYIPFRAAFPFLETIAPIGDITAGRDYTLFDIRGAVNTSSYKFAVLICFEDIFPELARSFVARGADFLVNITNDAWFGKSSEAYQHLAASVFRAVENRVNLVRCANTGISGFITPQGRTAIFVNGRVDPLFTCGYLSEDISIRRQGSIYGRYGDFLVPLACLCLAGIIMSNFRRKEDV